MVKVDLVVITDFKLRELGQIRYFAATLKTLAATRDPAAASVSQ